MPVQKKESRHDFRLVSLEELISEESEVRLIDAFVDFLNLEDLGFIKRGKSHEGKPAYEESILLKMYVYAYFNKIRSSRKIEKCCKLNIEMQWLVYSQTPSYKTISDFRKENKVGLKNTFKKFVTFLKSAFLLEDDVIAIDSSRFRGQNSKANNHNKKKLESNLKHNSKEIDKYLEALEKGDENESPKENIKLRLLELKQRRAKNQKLLQELEETGSTQISTTDPDAKRLAKKGSDSIVGYNIQIATTETHKIITNYEVTNTTDLKALSSMALASKAILETESLKVLADKGYDNGEEISKCESNNISTYVASRLSGKGKTKKQLFEYDEELNNYKCPQSKMLTTNNRVYKLRRKGKKVTTYLEYVISYKNECFNCPIKTSCLSEHETTTGKGKRIRRYKYEKYREENKRRVDKNKAFYKKRKALVEHPFGTIKRPWGFTYTLLKGKEKVAGEFGLVFLCYNLRRAISIKGTKELINLLKVLFLRLFDLSAIIKDSRIVNNTNLYYFYA